MTVLEENGGDAGNSSVAELEVRVETLEGTAADHDVNGKLLTRCSLLNTSDSKIFDNISKDPYSNFDHNIFLHFVQIQRQSPFTQC